jgi:pilus assembly protein CpaF
VSWDLILPFLKPLEPFLRDPEVTDVLVNGTRVFVERAGLLVGVAATINEKALVVAIRNIARLLGDDVSEDQPLLDARLPDGSRVAAVLPPCSVNGPSLAIRKFAARHFSLDDLVKVGTLTPEMQPTLETAVHDRLNVLVSGRTGAGKTTFLNALAALADEGERIVAIEDTSELQIAKPNVVRLEARRAQPGVEAVTMRRLLKATLRLRPDRILVGEIRGEEALELLQALNTGHRGTLSTTHANSAAESLERFALCVLVSGIGLSYEALNRQIGLGLQLLVHLDLRGGRRVVTEIVRVAGYDVPTGRFHLETLHAA